MPYKYTRQNAIEANTVGKILIAVSLLALAVWLGIA